RKSHRVNVARWNWAWRRLANSNEASWARVPENRLSARLERSKSAPARSASEKSPDVKSENLARAAPSLLALKLAPGPVRSIRLAPARSARSSWASDRSAATRAAPARLAPVRLARESLAWEKLHPCQREPLRSLSERSAPPSSEASTVRFRARTR